MLSVAVHRLAVKMRGGRENVTLTVEGDVSGHVRHCGVPKVAGHVSSP